MDWDRGVLRIWQTVTTGGISGRLEIKLPKGGKRRETNVPAEVLTALRDHRIRQNERRLALGADWNDMDLVFAGKTGTPLHPDNVDRDFNRLIAKAGVKPIRIHDQRHTFATLAIAAGKSPKAVAESLGHADVATTLRTYAHVTPSQRVDLAETIGALLFRPVAEAL